MEVGSPLPCNSKESGFECFFGIYWHLSQYDCSKVGDLGMKQTDSCPAGAINQH